MSDREDGENGRHSRNGSMSEQSEEDAKIVSYRSRSKEISRSPSGQPASPKSKHRYSRSRSRSRSRSHHRSSRRSRSRHRSRSRSLRRYRSRYSRSFSRSRSGSLSPYRGRRYHRSHSRSPMSNRRRHIGTRENPKPNKCLGVFGLSIATSENRLHHIFSKFGQVTKVQVVIDAKSGRSRGFAFVYFENFEDAKQAKDQCTGMEIDGRKIRVDFSVTQRAHTPTPGIYMGKPTYSDTRDVRWRDDDYYGGSGGSRRYDRYRRSPPSPYYSSSRRRYDRSHSRSYSPRRYY